MQLSLLLLSRSPVRTYNELKFEATQGRKPIATMPVTPAQRQSDEAFPVAASSGTTRFRRPLSTLPLTIEITHACLNNKVQ